MNTRNEIKITFGIPKTIIYGNFTKCYMTFEVKLPPVLELIANTLVKEGYVEKLPKSVKAMATVFPGDEYDENKGIKIAMAKAEIAAYTLVHNWLISILEIVGNDVHIKCVDFFVKSKKVIDHDKEYLAQF